MKRLSSQVRFDPETHSYSLEGRRIPSVTEILRATGVSKDFSVLAELSPTARESIALARQLGSALHADTHAYDDGDIVLETVDPVVRPYLDAWITFRENTGLVPVVRERRIYYSTFGYAGTLDGVFRKKDGTGAHCLIDIKTGDLKASASRFQLAAYLAAFLFEHPKYPTTIDRVAVQLCPELAVPYRTAFYQREDQARDFRAFTAFITTYHNQFERRAA